MNFGLHGFPRGGRTPGALWRVRYEPIDLNGLTYVDIPVPKGTTKIRAELIEASVGGFGGTTGYIKLGTKGVISSTGYSSDNVVVVAAGATITSVTTGYGIGNIPSAGGTNSRNELYLMDAEDSHTWSCASHNAGESATNYSIQSGSKSFSEEVDIMRVGAAAAFDGGTLYITFEGEY